MNAGQTLAAVQAQLRLLAGSSRRMVEQRVVEHPDTGKGTTGMNEHQSRASHSRLATLALATALAFGSAPMLAGEHGLPGRTDEQPAVVLHSPDAGAGISPEQEQARFQAWEQRRRATDDRVRQQARTREGVTGNAAETASPSTSIVLVNSKVWARANATGSFWMGELRSDLGVSKAFVKITLNLQDASGANLDSDYTYVDGSCLTLSGGIETGTNLVPHEIGFFGLYSDVSLAAVQKVTYTIAWENWEGVAPDAKVELAEPMTAVDNGGNVKLTGTFKNSGRVAAKYCYFSVALKDASGNMLDVNPFGSIQGSVVDGAVSGLEPGASAASSLTTWASFTQYSGPPSVKTEWDDYHPPMPVAAFTWSPTTPYVGQQVQFTDTSTGNPKVFWWDFGDGTSSTQPSPVHTFSTVGSKTVKHAISNTTGSSTITQTVVVTEIPPPTANFSWLPESPQIGDEIQFTDTSTDNPTSWSWDFGDGSTSPQQNPQHIYATHGSKSVVLTAANAKGSSTKTQTLVVLGPPPVADFTWAPTSPAVGQAIQFTDTSTDEPTSWSWDFGDGATSTEQNASHAYTTPGTKQVSLTATNASGSSVKTRTVGVAGPPSWIAVASHASGANRSQWRTDLGLLNTQTATVSYEARYYSGGEVKTSSGFVAAGAQSTLQDVVGQLGGSGSGALEVRCDLPLTVTSRTYNLVAADATCYPNGTVGQDYPAFVEADALGAGQSANLGQLVETAAYRTNIGLTNAGTAAASVAVSLFDGSGTLLTSYAVTLAPGELKQENRPFFNKAGQSSMQRGYARVRVTAGSGVYAFGSVVNNITNDPTTIPMVKLP